MERVGSAIVRIVKMAAIRDMMIEFQPRDDVDGASVYIQVSEVVTPSK